MGMPLADIKVSWSDSIKRCFAAILAIAKVTQSGAKSLHKLKMCMLNRQVDSSRHLASAEACSERLE